MNWPNYLVWDTYQADFIRKVVGNEAMIRIVGPIWFSSSNSELPTLPKYTIAVFDVQPMKDSFYKILGNDFDFYTKENSTRFLSDIYSICVKRGCSMVLKRKREGGRYVHREYRKMIKKFDSLPHYLSVDPDLSAYKLIENVFAVISMPYTSTALIAKQYNKPSVYYDPLQLLQKDDPAAHGIEIIQGRMELDDWINSLHFS
jgi:polysaccharide biosynthesis PFTS motif protein